jgi:hypothetical protein
MAAEIAKIVGAVFPRETERSMTPLVQPTNAGPWFLVRRDGSQRDVLMEFDTKDEAEDALCSASVELLVTADASPDGSDLAIVSAAEMFDDPALNAALAVWDAHVEELEIQIVQAMDDLVLGETPPILRPGRGSPS